MTFTESIKTCFSKYANFKGRASRSEYWWFALFIFLVGLILSIINRNIANVFYLGTLLPSIAVATRRLHDTNRSGWLQLIVLIPVIGWLIMLYFFVQEAREPNRF
ncbi:MAG: Integral rane protein [Burkholderiaceae bacterium]|nr:Integral rane protein [Burkholderiaceae bacterium]